jgi:uncharacterized membrane protein YkoI
VGKAMIWLVFLVAWFVPGPAAWAQTETDKEHAALAKAMAAAKVPLQRGLAAGAKEGKPISGKYEVEDGKLQLSVYTMKAGKFAEVIVDPATGKVVKKEPITEGDDLGKAKAQRDAMASAKRSLEAAAAGALKANAGFRVVSVTPGLKDGHPVADVMLLKGDEWKTVSEKLD